MSIAEKYNMDRFETVKASTDVIVIQVKVEQFIHGVIQVIGVNRVQEVKVIVQEANDPENRKGSQGHLKGSE